MKEISAFLHEIASGKNATTRDLPKTIIRDAKRLVGTLPKFVILLEEGHEEGVHVFLVDGVEVGRCDHDSAGWQGMEEQSSMFKSIATQLGVKVKTKYPEE